ncbi:MAG: sugar nucleotide-binding protein, partial [Microcoleaceae cyanobacterium]
MQKILLIGANGQLGKQLQPLLQPLGELIAVGRQELDLTNPDAITNLVATVKPQVIVNAAAYTMVDKAESDQEIAIAVNGKAPGVLA